MCGRFAFYSPAEAAAQLFGVENAPAVEPRYNIAPTQYIAAIRHDAQQQPEIAMLRWGLVPFWAQDPAIGNRMINARAETLAGKPAYRDAYRNRRCLILADGFYEWRKVADGKTPYFISAQSGNPFAFAGLWESWQDSAQQESLLTATIITTAATPFLQRLHQRMPVIVTPALSAKWLSGEANILQQAVDTMPELQAWPVARTVNNARNEGEELIRAAGEAPT